MQVRGLFGLHDLRSRGNRTQHESTLSAASAPSLSADLVAGLKRLTLATIRSIAPDVLHVAKTQRWPPEELLRTLVEAEIAAREQSNTRTRLRAAGFPVAKTLDEFNLALSSLPQATFDYLTTASPKSSTPCCAPTSSSSTNSASPHSTSPAHDSYSASSPPPTNAAFSASPATGPSTPGGAFSSNTPPPHQ